MTKELLQQAEGLIEDLTSEGLWFESEAAPIVKALSDELRGEEKKIHKLWQLLDDIDTLDDAAKDSDKNFREVCYKIQQKRWDIYNPDLPQPKKEK